MSENNKNYQLEGEVFDAEAGPIERALLRCKNLQESIYSAEETLRVTKDMYNIIAKQIATDMHLAKHVPSQIEGLPGTWKTLDTLDDVVRELLKQRNKGLK